MLSNYRKFLCLILAFCLLLGLCGCDNSSNDKVNHGKYDGDLPQGIFGTWYPHPEVSDAFIAIYEDGTCAINGQTENWQVDSVTEDSVCLFVGTNNQLLTFKQLNSPLPILSESNYGISVKDPELWTYMVEWYNADTGNAFSLDLEELAKTNCNLRFENGQMTIEVLEGENITHTIAVSGSQAIVTTAEGISTTYFPINGGNFGNNEESQDPQIRYVKALEDLQAVLSGKHITDYVDSNGVSHMISGAEAIEKLYKIFVSLQDHIDVSEELNCIRKIDNVPVKKYTTTIGLNRTPTKIKYNHLGRRTGLSLEDALNTGEYLYLGYEDSDNDDWFVICGVVGGNPVYGSNGRVTALKITSGETGTVYTAPITYDTKGRVTRVDIPFAINEAGEKETDFSQYYTFLYDSNGRLIQYSHTMESHNGIYENNEFYQVYGFFSRDVVECYYHADGKLKQTIKHSAIQGSNGATLWYYTDTVYTYNSSKNLVSSHMEGGTIHMSIPNTVGISRDEITRMQNIQKWVLTYDKFVDSIGKDFLGQLGAHYESTSTVWDIEYEYGSIYVYQAEE